MWGKIIIPMYRLWLNSLYGLYGPRCPLFSKRPINLICLSLSLSLGRSLWNCCEVISSLAYEKSTLVWEMALSQVTSHYLSQCWSRSVTICCHQATMSQCRILFIRIATQNNLQDSMCFLLTFVSEKLTDWLIKRNQQNMCCAHEQFYACQI